MGSRYPAMFTRNAARPSLCPHNTCANDLLDLDICRVYLPGKFSDGLAGVLVCGWVDVILHPKPYRCMACVRRVWHKAGLPTHHRHALLLAKMVPRSSPQPWGIPALPGMLLARDPSFCLCNPHPNRLTWAAVLLQLLCVACLTPLPEGQTSVLE